jgi:polysaccharide export outer membrane protein
MQSVVTRLALGARRAPSRQQRPVKHERGFKGRVLDCLVALSLLPMAAAMGGGVAAQEAGAAGPSSVNEVVAAAPAVEPPAGFVIGPEDVLSIVFWRDKEMTTQVTVRPDGKISLPLLDEVQAAGLTPADLRAHLTHESKRFFGNPTVTVVVNQINSRKVFITGQVAKPGSYVIVAPTTVLQLIAMAGGLKDFADSKNIMIVRHDGGRTSSHAFNYKAIGRNLGQNIELKPGDTVVVP